LTEKPKLPAFIAISLTALFWGVSFVSTKVAVQVVPPMLLAFTRFVLASILLRVFLKLRMPGFRLRRKDVLPFLLAGAFGITLYFFCEANGVKRISPSVASIIVAVIPVAIHLIDAFFYQGSLSLRKIVAVVMSVAGVYLVVFRSMRSGSTAGYLFMFGAVAAWVAFNFLTRPLFRRYPRLVIVCYQTIFGTLLFIPFAALEIRHVAWQSVNPVLILHILYLGIFCSALGYAFYIYAMNELGIAVTSLFINLVPAITAATAALFLGETLRWIQIGGGGIVIASVFMATWEAQRAGRASSDRNA
jgi:drug/metabolite transporter (DMT)-like permease